MQWTTIFSFSKQISPWSLILLNTFDTNGPIMKNELVGLIPSANIIVSFLLNTTDY